MPSSLYLLATTLGVASAHTIMQAVGVGSTTYPQGEGIYMPSDDSFIGDPTSDSMACNGPPVTNFQSSDSVIEVTAGDTVTGSWLHTLTSTGPDSTADNKVIDSSHKGPVLAYMKKVDDATQNPSAGPGDGWFKVAEAGLISSDQWAVDALIDAGGVQSVEIPTCIEDGDYLLRFELIALHSAYDAGGAQFYMECAQIRVSGGSGSASPETHAIPGIYSADDPGIQLMIFNDQGQPYPDDAYVIPGPAPFTCDGAPRSSNSSLGATPIESSDISSEAPEPAATEIAPEASSVVAPTGGYAAPTEGYAAPTGGYAAPTGGYAAPTGGNTSVAGPSSAPAQWPSAPTTFSTWFAKPTYSYEHHNYECSG